MADPALALFHAFLRNDPMTFIKKVYAELHPSGSLDTNWHIDAIAYQLAEVAAGRQRRLIINVPPRSLKSIILSVALPAFILGKMPSAKIICVSYAQSLASKHARDFRRILEADWYQAIFPGTVIAKEAEELIETTMGGARLSTSIGAAMTGFGGDFIIIDDPMRPDEAPSELARDKVIRHYREVLYSRQNHKVQGCIIVVMQRLHEDDLTGHLLRDGGWKALVYPAIAIVDETIELGNGRTHERKVGDVLHPAREPLSTLEDLRRNLGGSGFEAQYQQSPIPPGGNMVKQEWVRNYRRPPARHNVRVTQSWDTALKGDTANDYSVCTTWLDQAGHHYLIDVFRAKLDFPALVKTVFAQQQKHTPDAILVEDQGSGISLIQQLKSGYGVFAIPRRSKDDKETRLSVVLPMFEAGQIFVPEDSPWLPDLLKELYGFPRAKHDDQVDSITQYLIWARDRGSFVFEADFGPEGGAPSPSDMVGSMRGFSRW